MSDDHLCATAVAWETRSPVRIKLLDEGATLSACIAVVAETGSTRFDRFSENADNGIAEERSLFERYRSARSRWIDARSPECLVRVNVADACDFALLHQYFFHWLATTSKNCR
jgi:hypothetical protein